MMFAAKPRHLVGLLTSLALLTGCGGGAASAKDGGTLGSDGGGNASGTGALTGATAFAVKSAVVLWSKGSDGGLAKNSVRVMITDQSLETACADAQGNFGGMNLTLHAHDIEYFGLGDAELGLGAYPVRSGDSRYAQDLYWDVSMGALMSPTAQVQDGGVTLDGVDWPSVTAGVASGGSVRGSFEGALQFGADTHDSVTGTFRAVGCDNVSLH